MATISFDEKVVVTDPEMVEKMKRDIEGEKNGRLTVRDSSGAAWCKRTIDPRYGDPDTAREMIIDEIVDRLAELEDKIENGTLVEATIVTGFVNNFIDYLLKSEAECADTERENIEVCIYQEIFQVFGRKVEKQLGIKVFEEDGENGN